MDWTWWLIGVLVALLVLTWWWGRTRVGRANRSRQRRAQWGEDAAERLLEQSGFSILDRQLTGEWPLWIDGRETLVRCRADLLVQRGPDLFIAEVKTGDRAPDPTHPSTRRQLLEYQLAFDVDGVLLVDMEARAVRRVEFPQ